MRDRRLTAKDLMELSPEQLRENAEQFAEWKTEVDGTLLVLSMMLIEMDAVLRCEGRLEIALRKLEDRRAPDDDQSVFARAQRLVIERLREQVAEDKQGVN